MNSLTIVRSVRSGRSRTRTSGLPPCSPAASIAQASSSMLSTVRRAPTEIARAISCGDLVEPLTEICDGSTPASRAISSSAAPNTSHPAPASFRIRRSAALGFAFSDASTRVGPCRQLLRQRVAPLGHVGAKLRLGVDVERRPEAGGELRGGQIFDHQTSVVDPDRRLRCAHHAPAYPVSAERDRGLVRLPSSPCSSFPPVTCCEPGI